MRHVGFCEVLILARHGVPWDVAMGWTNARRLAALEILRGGEGSGGGEGGSAW